MSAIETERLQLRQWSEDDFEAFATFYASAADARYVGGHKDRPDAWRHLALLTGHMQLRGFGLWAVEEKTSGEFVGAAGLWQPEGWPELELDYWLLPAYRGKGYAHEAGSGCIEYARIFLQAQSLVSYVEASNAPAIKTAEKLGAHYETTIELLQHGSRGVYRHF